MPKSLTSLLFLFGSQSQEQHQRINTDILTPMSVPLKTHPNSKLKDVVNQSMKHFLLHVPSLSPEKFLNQGTPMCWTRARFSAGMRHSFRYHLKKSKKMQSPAYRSEHDPENEPPKAPDDDGGRRSVPGQAGEGPEWAEEYPQEPRFQELRFPSCSANM